MGVSTQPSGIHCRDASTCNCEVCAKVSAGHSHGGKCNRQVVAGTRQVCTLCGGGSWRRTWTCSCGRRCARTTERSPPCTLQGNTTVTTDFMFQCVLRISLPLDTQQPNPLRTAAGQVRWPLAETTPRCIALVDTCCADARPAAGHAFQEVPQQCHRHSRAGGNVQTDV